MFGSSLRLFSFRGIEVKADVSWLFIVALVTWSFWGRFVVWYDRSTGVALVMALAAAVLFFGSILAHELAHSLEARRRGVEVGGITLFVFGGATETKFDVKRPIDEFALTAIGPYTSFVLSAVFGLAAVAADGADWTGGAIVFGTLGWLNLALGIFNLLPGAPLDGGRILRAAVWKITGDRQRSVIVAANAGRVLGGLIIGLGLLQLFATANVVGGIWFALIGWFLYRAASAERLSVEIEDLLHDRRAEHFVDGASPVPAEISIERAIDEWFARHEEQVYPVTSQGRVIGVVDVSDVRGVDVHRRAETTVGAIARPIDDLPHIDRAAPASEVIDAGEDLLIVTDESGAVGIITPRRVIRTIDRLQRLERELSDGGPRPRRPHPEPPRQRETMRS